MIWSKVVAVVFIGILILSGCSAPQNSDENTAYHKIEAKEAKQMMEQQDVICLLYTSWQTKIFKLGF